MKSASVSDSVFVLDQELRAAQRNVENLLRRYSESGIRDTSTLMNEIRRGADHLVEVLSLVPKVRPTNSRLALLVLEALRIEIDLIADVQDDSARQRCLANIDNLTVYLRP